MFIQRTWGTLRIALICASRLSVRMSVGMLVGRTGHEKIGNPDEYRHPNNKKREEVYDKVVCHIITSRKAYGAMLFGSGDESHEVL